MEAEQVHGADQAGKSPAGKYLPMVRHQALHHRAEVRDHVCGARVRVARDAGAFGGRRASEALQRGGRAGVDQRQRLAIGLVPPLRRGVVRRLRQILQPCGDPRRRRGDGELRPQGVDLGQIPVKGGRGVAAEGFGQHLGRHVGIAVPVAAHPGPDAQEAGQIGGSKRRLPGLIETRQAVEEGALEEEGGVVDLVQHRKTRMPQKARVPEQSQLRLHGRFDLRLSGRRGAGAAVEEFAQRRQPVEDGLAADLGGVSGQDGGHRRLLELTKRGRPRHLTRRQGGDGGGQRRRSLRLIGLGAHQPGANGLIFGQIGHLEEQRKAVGGLHRFVRRQAQQTFVEA